MPVSFFASTEKRFPGANLIFSVSDLTNYGCSAGSTFIYPETNKSLFDAAERVIPLTQRINVILNLLCSRKSLAKETYQWVKGPEGGFSTQLIQDLVLLSDAYESAIRRFTPVEIHLHSSIDSLIEDLALKSVAESLGVKLKLSWKASFKMRLSAIRHLTIRTAKSFYIVQKAFRQSTKDPATRCQPRQVTFQLASTHSKHFNNVASLVQDLHQAQIRSNILHWSSGSRYNLGSSLLNALPERDALIPQERFLAASDFLFVFSTALNSALNLLSSRAAISANISRRTNEPINISNLLTWALLAYLLIDLPSKILFATSVKRYFKSHSTKYFFPHGGYETQEGRVSCKYFRNQKINDKILFHRLVGTTIEWPYAYTDNPIDIQLVHGEIELDRLRNQRQCDRDRFSIVSTSRHQAIETFKLKNKKVDSQRSLSINPDSLVLFLDMSAFVRGSESWKELIGRCYTTFQFAKENKNVTLIAKAHPSGPISHVDYFKSHFQSDNILYLDRKSSPLDALNACDILLTKYSTLGIEAMLLDKIIISCHFSTHPNFKIFGDAALYVHSNEELEKCLKSFATDSAWLSMNKREFLRKSSAFLDRYFSSRTNSSVLKLSQIVKL